MSDRRRVQMYTTGVGENEERVRERKRAKDGRIMS